MVTGVPRPDLTWRKPGTPSLPCNAVMEPLDIIPGKLAVQESDRFFTVRLNVAGLKVEYRDGVLEVKLPKPQAARR